MALMVQKEIIDRARSEGRSLLTEVEAKEILMQAEINVVDMHEYFIISKTTK